MEGGTWEIGHTGNPNIDMSAASKYGWACKSWAGTTLQDPPIIRTAWRMVLTIGEHRNDNYRIVSRHNRSYSLWGTMRRKSKRLWMNLLPQTPPHPQGDRQLVILRERIERKREKLLDRINKKKKGVFFKMNEWVLAKACNVWNATTGAMAKFLALYEAPYRIKKHVATNVYILCDTQSEKERGQCHANDLRKYLRRNSESGEEENIASGFEES